MTGSGLIDRSNEDAERRSSRRQRLRTTLAGVGRCMPLVYVYAVLAVMAWAVISMAS